MFDEITAAVAPLIDLPQRVNLYDYLDRMNEFAEWPLWRQRLIHAMQELKRLGINEKAMTILARWQCPPDRVLIQGLAKGYLVAKAKVVEQRRVRQSLVNYLMRINHPSISPHLQKDIEEEFRVARESLDLELLCYKNVLRILRRNGAKLTPRSQKPVQKSKPRDPSTAQTVRELHRLLMPTHPSRNARAKIIYQLLKIADPKHAPSSSNSIRAGYR